MKIDITQSTKYELWYMYNLITSYKNIIISLVNEGCLNDDTIDVFKQVYTDYEGVCTRYYNLIKSYNQTEDNESAQDSAIQNNAIQWVIDFDNNTLTITQDEGTFNLRDFSLGTLDTTEFIKRVIQKSLTETGTEQNG